MPSLAVFGHRTTTFSFVLVWVHESSEHDAKPCDDSLLRNTSHCSLLRMSPVHGPGLVYLEHKYPQYIASYIRQCLCTVSEATRHPRTSSPVTSCILRPFAEAHSTKFVTRCTGFLCAVYPESRSPAVHQAIRPSVHWKCSNRCNERRRASDINSRYRFAKGDYVRMALLREPQQNHTGSLGAKGALRNQDSLYLQHSCDTTRSNLDSPPASISSHRTQFDMGDTSGHSLNALDLRFLLPSYGECLEASAPYNRRLSGIYSTIPWCFGCRVYKEHAL